MTDARHSYMPVVPDHLETEEWLGVVVDDGREQGIRSRVNMRADLTSARADAERFAARLNDVHRRAGRPETARVVLLHRTLGPWEVVT